MFINALLGRRVLQRSRRFLSLKTGEVDIAGLLVGANGTFFTTNLNLGAAANLVQNSDAIFRKAIIKDVQVSGVDAQQYLSKVEEMASQYLEEDDICGRSAICADIKEAMLKKGSLVFITGGRSVGKSKIMASIVEAIREDQITGDFKPPPQVRVSMIMVDGRRQRNVLDALGNVATGQAAAMANKATKFLPTFTFTSLSGIAVGFDFKGINFSCDTVGAAMEVLATNHPNDHSHTVLILDEANLFLRCAGKEAAAQRTSELYNAIVMLTKQRKRMSVVLVSSDEGLPYHLQDLGENADHISHTLVIGEPTPRESLDLLRNKLGVGEHLSNALVDCYGGHVYQMCVFLEKLPSAYKRSEINISMGPATNIDRAVSAWMADEGDEAEILAVLEELARTGFVPMSRRKHSKLARLLTKFNICAFLTEGALEYQVPKEFREKRAGLVAGSQLLRVLLAWKLMDIEVGVTYCMGVYYFIIIYQYLFLLYFFLILVVEAQLESNAYAHDFCTYKVAAVQKVGTFVTSGFRLGRW